MTETVTRLRPTSSGTDSLAQPIPGTPTETPIDGALFNPGGSSEPVEPGRTPVITEPTLYFRNQWPDITAKDQVRVRGVVYDVEGDPAVWHRGEQVRGGLVVPLKRAGG